MYSRTLPNLLRYVASHTNRRGPIRPIPAANEPAFLPDNDALADMLRSGGYQVEVQRFGAGEATCLISLESGDERYIVEAELSPGTSRIWLAARIGIADLHQAAAPLLARLLGENVGISPHFFAYRARDQRLLLHVSLENRDLTPVRLRNHLERLAKRIHDTRPAWAALVRHEDDAAGAAAMSRQHKEEDVERTWCSFTSVEGKFHVQLPDDPRIDTQSLTTDKGPIDLHIVFAEEPGARVSYGVCYSDLDGSARAEGDPAAEEVLAQARQAVVQLMNGKVLEERPIALEGHPGLELMVHSAEKGAAVARVFCIGDRFFQVLAVGEDVSLFQPTVRSFLESFRLMRE